MTRAPWPKLSETLTGPVDPQHCQACGTAHQAGNPLARWREGNDQDRPTRVIVVLCQRCSRRIVEPHPRLYTVLSNSEVCPGCMSICRPCAHRVRNSCESPLYSINGGEGLIFEPRPTRTHLYFGGGRGGWFHLLPSPATRCSGFEPAIHQES